MWCSGGDTAVAERDCEGKEVGGERLVSGGLPPAAWE